METKDAAVAEQKRDGAKRRSERGEMSERPL